MVQAVLYLQRKVTAVQQHLSMVPLILLILCLAAGTQIGTSGWYCVYNGTGTSVNVTGLEPLTNYIFHVIEFETGPSYYTQTGQANPVVLQTNAFSEQTG